MAGNGCLILIRQCEQRNEGEALPSVSVPVIHDQRVHFSMISSPHVLN
jgi:hypothetical protein